jgi:hypothetical protein
MAQGNMTGGNSTSENMTETNLTSTTPAGVGGSRLSTLFICGIGRVIRHQLTIFLHFMMIFISNKFLTFKYCLFHSH